MSESHREISSLPDQAAGTPFDRVPLPIRGVLYYIAFLAFILGLVPWAADRGGRFLPWSFDLPSYARWIGWGLFAFSFGTYSIASFVLMRRGRGAYVEFDPPKEFVATGPFRWCRNPIAACLLGAIFGEALAFSSIGILALFLIGLPLAHMQVVMLEEPLLRKRFGETYEEYLRTVPRWIPRPPRRKSA